VKGGDRKVVWLGKVDGDASLALLGRLLDETKKEEPADRLIAAIAHHASPKADAIIEKRALDRSSDEDTRKQAIFWAGNTRGDSGYRLVEKVLDSDPDSDIRQHAVFALTQNDSSRAVERIKEVALEDRSTDVRGQALFWLAQTKAPGVGDWIVARLDAEQNEDVREQAVFALSQLPDATDRLLDVLRSKRDPEIVRRALFWLGQSNDPRALDEIEKILSR
jgi:HEAT repeat protein